MTDTTNSASSENPATAVDVQDPLPESDWFWRRTYTFVLSLLLIGGTAYVLYGLRDFGDADGLLEMGLRILWVLTAVITFYLIAPSAEQLARIIQSARIITSGNTITKTATVETPGGTTTSVTTSAGSEAVGAPPAPPGGGYQPRPGYGPGRPPSQGGSGRGPDVDVAPRSRG